MRVRGPFMSQQASVVNAEKHIVYFRGKFDAFNHKRELLEEQKRPTRGTKETY